MLIIYTWILRLLFPIIILRLLWRGLRNPAYWRRWPERFGFIRTVDRSPVIWVHAVSVGEVKACAPLLKALMVSHGDHHIHITTMTPTGSAQVVELFKDQVSHSYVPYDYPGAVKRFLAKTRPKLLMIMETELWPNIFHLCNKKKILILLVNARLSERSMYGYLNHRSLTKATLNQISIITAQTKGDADRLIRLGAYPDRITVTGSIKFDLDIPESVIEQGKRLRARWGSDRRVWIAASTHAGEDEIVLKAYQELKQGFPKLLLILVPRHPERFMQVSRMCRNSGYRVELRSEADDVDAGKTDIVVGDTMGELQLLFTAADVAFIGGSLVAVGGHNLLEASAVGVPVIFGPHMHNFQEISELVIATGTGRLISSGSELPKAVGAYIGDKDARQKAGKAGKEMVARNRGALARVLTQIEKLLLN